MTILTAKRKPTPVQAKFLTVLGATATVRKLADSTQRAHEAREHMEECISKPGGRG